jgi:hypothetical protein
MCLHPRFYRFFFFATAYPPHVISHITELINSYPLSHHNPLLCLCVSNICCLYAMCHTIISSGGFCVPQVQWEHNSTVQDRVKEINFSFLFKQTTEWTQYIKKCLWYTGHQAMDFSDPLESGNNFNPAMVPVYGQEKVSRL